MKCSVYLLNCGRLLNRIRFLSLVATNLRVVSDLFLFATIAFKLAPLFVLVMEKYIQREGKSLRMHLESIDTFVTTNWQAGGKGSTHAHA